MNVRNILERISRKPRIAAGFFALFLTMLAAVLIAQMPVSNSAKIRKTMCADIELAGLQACAPPSGRGDEEVIVVSPKDEEKEKSDRAVSRKKIREAEKLYRRAVKTYKRGDSNEARALYERSLSVLREAPLSADTWYRVKDDVGLLFHKLNKASSPPERSARSGATIRPIPLDRESALVGKYLEIYTQGKPRKKVLEALERSGRYRGMILSVLDEYGLPEELVYLPILESLYNENDLSRAGALGLWQLMPSRARELGLKVNYWVDERKDPEKSTRAAARYLKQLFLMFDDWHLALAAYNRGENGLGRDLALSNATNIEGLREQKAIPRETQNYVPQFIVCVLIGRDPEKYGFEPEYEEPLEYDEVTINKAIDLEVAARCAGTTPKALRKLNPALMAWCTPVNYPRFVLRLPEGSKDAFIAALKAESELNPSEGYVKYQVRYGDSLASIARKFCTTPSAIRDDNRILKYRRCKVDQILLIRPGKRYNSLAKK